MTERIARTLLHSTGVLHSMVLKVETVRLHSEEITLGLEEGEVVQTAVKMFKHILLVHILQTIKGFPILVFCIVSFTTTAVLWDFDKEVLVLGAWLVVNLLVGVLLV